MSDIVLANKKKQNYATDVVTLVLMRVNSQLFGVPVEYVQDALKQQKVAPIPLSPPDIVGSINLRGRIVTVIDLRKRLKLPEKEQVKPPMFVVIEYKNELYSLIVDSVSEVINISKDNIENSPTNLSVNWKEVSSGICQLERELLIVINVPALLS